MAVYKRGNVYWYKFEFLGKPYQATTRLRNKRQAEQFEDKLKTDLRMGLVGLAPLKIVPTLQKYKDRALAFIETNTKSPETIGFYKEKLAQLLAYKPLAECPLDRIDEELVENFREHRGKTVAITTVHMELRTLRRILHIARDTHKLITRLPKIRIPSSQEPMREFVLNYEQEAAYLGVAGDTLRDFAILALDLGLRVGEGVRLEWDGNVYFEPLQGAEFGHIYIRRGKSAYAKRRLPMTERVREVLEKRRKFLAEERFVFPSPTKDDAHILVTSVNHLHAKARSEARVDTGNGFEDLPQKEFVVHSLRHTFGTRLGESGADAFDIQRIMGHSSITISQRYVHPTPEKLEGAFRRLDSMNQLLRGDKTAERKLGVVTESVTVEKGRR